MSTNQFAVSFIPEDTTLETIHFHDLNELECKPYQNLYTIHFITRSIRDNIISIQSLVGKFGNLIISSDIMLYGAFVSIDAKFDNPVFTDPFYKEIPIPSPYCTIDFQFSGQAIGSDLQFLKSHTSKTFDNYNYDYSNTSSASAKDSGNHQSSNKKVKIEEKIKRELKRKITFK